ncbi:MFS transporter [Erythrobacter sp.]|uniref:MFS transporter n=1 Tax=Erythrobacter sp. TaxID=1042 RepID=UPI0025BA85A0|nr:MFS transporter [Erythrobacter sp.]
MNETPQRQPAWFLALFALAVAGGTIAYVPLLTVLLPLRIAAISGGEDVAGLSLVTFLGAIVASIANIAFGMLSDRTGSRIPWIVGGLVISSALLVAIGEARTLGEAIVLVMLWQAGLNMMLGPLVAWAGDCFPDSQKGVLGGALALAPAMGALSGSLVTFEGWIEPVDRLTWVAGIVVALVVPALLAGRGRRRAALMRADAATERMHEEAPRRQRSLVARMWIARFLVQIAEAGLFAFLLFWLRSLDPDFHENTAANIFSAVLVVSVPLTIAIGRWSDRRVRPILPLAASAAGAAAGLLAMAFAGGMGSAIAGYVVFGISASIFLSLHTAQTLRVLPQPRHRGRDLGIFNLTNTAPSMVMPWLTLALVPGFGFTGLFVLFAALAMLAAVLLAAISQPAAR